MGWPNCIRLYNSEIELIIATDIGIRILYFGFAGGKNIFYLSPEDLGKKGGDQWRIYGGHRLWHAPEAIPRTYSPDNDPISYLFGAGILKLIQPVEKDTGIIKEMEIYLSADTNHVHVVHRLINNNPFPLNLAAWALSALIPEGTAVVPQEPFGAGNDFLLPARSLALWNYTQMNDSRWNWGNKYILATPDSVSRTEQKIGLLNKSGWAAYCMEHAFLVKVFGYDPFAVYADFMSNNELYFNGQFLELETLGPYVNIPAGDKTENHECWQLVKGRIEVSEQSIADHILPLLPELQKMRSTHIA
jgi:hypothetical protein